MVCCRWHAHTRLSVVGGRQRESHKDFGVAFAQNPDRNALWALLRQRGGSAGLKLLHGWQRVVDDNWCSGVCRFGLLSLAARGALAQVHCGGWDCLLLSGREGLPLWASLPPGVSILIIIAGCFAAVKDPGSLVAHHDRCRRLLGCWGGRGLSPQGSIPSKVGCD